MIALELREHILQLPIGVNLDRAHTRKVLRRNGLAVAQPNLFYFEACFTNQLSLRNIDQGHSVVAAGLFGLHWLPRRSHNGTIHYCLVVGKLCVLIVSFSHRK